MELSVVAELLGVADGAMGLLQKAIGKGNPDSGFDSLFSSILSDKGSKTDGISALLGSGEDIDLDDLDAIFGQGAGMFLFQLFFALKEMGINTADLKALLSGKGEGISDKGFTQILSCLGLSNEEITGIMGDSGLESRVRTAIGASVKAFMEAGSSAGSQGNPEMARLLKVIQDNPEMMDQGFSRLVKVTDNADVSQNRIIASMKASVKGVLEGSEVAVVVNKASNNESPAQSAKMNRIIEVLTKELGISRESLKDIVMSAERTDRQAAAKAIQAKVSAFLKKGGLDVPKGDFKDALGFLKASMSEKEVSGLEKTFRSLQPNLVFPDAKMPVSREMLATLGRSLGVGTQADQTLEGVMDQLKRSMAMNIKNSQGNVSLKLYPPVLGRVDVNVSMSDGRVNAVFRVDMDLTRDMLQQNVHFLKEALAQQGVKVASLNITSGMQEKLPDGAYSFARQQQQDPGQGASRHSGRRKEEYYNDQQDDDDILVRSFNRAAIGYAGGLDVIA
ncbi:MAG: flagellar hook-length control protein FliK [Thermodesulfobacteriota bacterium]|nr:flagellar hook-length control protein FliK [Thermodesulfobacteriota bacterium]